MLIRILYYIFFSEHVCAHVSLRRTRVCRTPEGLTNEVSTIPITDPEQKEQESDQNWYFYCRRADSREQPA
jgi:hypothetical protein